MFRSQDLAGRFQGQNEQQLAQDTDRDRRSGRRRCQERSRRHTCGRSTSSPGLHSHPTASSGQWVQPRRQSPGIDGRNTWRGEAERSLSAVPSVSTEDLTSSLSRCKWHLVRQGVSDHQRSTSGSQKRSTCCEEGFLYAIAMVHINIDVQHPRVVLQQLQDRQHDVVYIAEAARLCSADQTMKPDSEVSQRCTSCFGLPNMMQATCIPQAYCALLCQLKPSVLLLFRSETEITRVLLKLTSDFLPWCRPPAQLMAMSAEPQLSLTAPPIEPPAYLVQYSYRPLNTGQSSPTVYRCSASSNCSCGDSIICNTAR